MINKKPLYNLNAVLREVNITPDVLRAWERRYQLPVPQRTAGGHRLYSDYDIEIIKWLQARQVEGFSISRAVNLWREMAANSDPLESLPTATVVGPDTNIQNNITIEIYRDEWLRSCLAFDTVKAESVLNQALSLFPIENVCIQLIQQALHIIGEKWHEGSVSVQQEHFATAMAHNRLQTMIAGTPNPLFDKTVLIGCPAGELHTFPGLLLNLFMRREGYKVIYLGADLPVEQLVEAADRINPSLTILSAQRLPTAKTLNLSAAILHSHNHPVGFGGRVFTRVSALAALIAGYYLGDSLETSIFIIKKLITHPGFIDMPYEAIEGMKSLTREYDENRGLVEHRVVNIFKSKSIAIPNMQQINTFFGDTLSSVLFFGDLSLMNNDVNWIKKSYQRMDPSGNFAITYMNAYRQALIEEMGLSSLPITKWIESTFLENRN